MRITIDDAVTVTTAQAVRRADRMFRKMLEGR